MISNYIKLTARASRRLDDGDSLPRSVFDNVEALNPLTDEGTPRVFLTDWVFFFDDRDSQSIRSAEDAAFDKREELTARLSDSLDCELCMFRGNGVFPEIGAPSCELTAMALSHEGMVS